VLTVERKKELKMKNGKSVGTNVLTAELGPTM
jgi:hypothetical protein